MFRPFQKGYWNELLGEVKDELSESTGNSHVCQCPGCTWQVEDKDTAAAANRKSDVDKTSITSSSILRTVKTASVSGTSFSRISTGRPATGSNTASSGVQNSSLEAGSTGNSSLQDAAVAAAAAAATTEDAGQGRASVEAARQDMAEEANRRDSALSVFRSSLSLDEEAWDRAVQRRETLKEFLNTESTYVTGLKSLADALSTYIPTRTTIYRSTLEMLALHQRLLEGLVIFIPPADHSIPSASFFQCPNRPPQDEGCVAAKPNPDASGGKDVKPNRRSLTSRALKQPIETRIRTSKHVAAETKDAARVAQLLQAIVS
ncbi:hypothetical protein KEM55_000289 [Ascosphaera atra]|nr:hypothetical protein KEM55_000289 [Ascosphaera atra]